MCSVMADIDLATQTAFSNMLLPVWSPGALHMSWSNNPRAFQSEAGSRADCSYLFPRSRFQDAPGFLAHAGLRPPPSRRSPLSSRGVHRHHPTAAAPASTATANTPMAPTIPAYSTALHRCPTRYEARGIRAAARPPLLVAVEVVLTAAAGRRAACRRFNWTNTRGPASPLQTAAAYQQRQQDTSHTEACRCHLSMCVGHGT